MVSRTGSQPGMLHAHRLIANQGTKPCTSGSRPASTRVRFRRNRSALGLASKLAGQTQDGEIVLGQADCEFLDALDLFINRNFSIDDWHTEMLAEESVGLLPIVQLVIVGSGIDVFMPGKSVFFAIQSEERPDLIV